MSEEAPNPMRRRYDAWIAPNGEFFPMGMWEHDGFAYERFKCSGSMLMRRGWVKLAGGNYYPTRGTQAQLDALFDWQRVNDRTLPFLHLFEVQ